MTCLIPQSYFYIIKLFSCYVKNTCVYNLPGFHYAPNHKSGPGAGKGLVWQHKQTKNHSSNRHWSEKGMVEVESNSCLMHGVFVIYTIPFGITYQKAFRSSPVNPEKRLEETSYTVVTFSSSQNILQSHQINLPSHPSLSGQLLGGSCLLCVSLVISVSTGSHRPFLGFLKLILSLPLSACCLPCVQV